MSSTSTSPTSSASPQPSFTGGNNNGGTGVSSSLYLFTFLITVLVLAIISSALLFRAYYIRRRFQLRVEEAIRNNQPLPPDAARALGLLRPGGSNGKKERKLGPMPAMWEAEMLLDQKAGEMDGGCVGREEWQDRESRKWEEFTPLSIVQPSYYVQAEFSTPQYIIPAPRQRRYLPSWVPISQPLPRIAHDHEQVPASITRSGPNYLIPPIGQKLTVGVLIALPFDEKVENVWTRDPKLGEEDEMEVPEVLLGVVAVKVE